MQIYVHNVHVEIKKRKKNVGINKLKMLFGNFDNKESFILCFYIGVFQACFADLFKMKKTQILSSFLFTVTVVLF